MPVSLPRPAEAALVAASPAAGAAPGTAPVPRGPRMSWGGFLTILLILLASIGVLLGVLPLISATSTTIDAMASRQARTLAGWLSSAVSEEGAIDQSVVDSVLSQDGVQQAVLLDAATGRVVAPSRLIGRPMADLPGAGGRWRSLRQPLVTTTGTARDALMPVAAGSAGHVAWVRYEPPAGSDSGLALIVALGATLVLALVVSLLIKRHTAAALHSFTRQVELAVSGANPKVMQGTLVPGLERLPGIVSYLLEQQKARITPEDRVLPSAPATARAVVDVPPPPPQPPWLEVTPSLSVAEVSPNAPPEVGDWTAAPGRHLLDVMTDAATRNAVVQALGALGMAAGAEVSMPVEGRPAVTLRRETSGHVRVTFATR